MEHTQILQVSSQLNKEITALLGNFEKNNKNWADLSPWLASVEKVLKDYQSHLITDKITFAKRLAQCLNPQLTYAIHQQTLVIYEQIFINMKKYAHSLKEDYNRVFAEDMGFYSVGLFPFYQNCSAQVVKQQFLRLIREYYVPVGRELIPCLPGLIFSLIPGLEDNVEVVSKELKQIFELLNKAVGRRYFIGCLWMGIQRQRRGRSSAIKLLRQYIRVENPQNDEGALGSDEALDKQSVQDQQTLKALTNPELLGQSKLGENQTEIQSDAKSVSVRGFDVQSVQSSKQGNNKKALSELQSQAEHSQVNGGDDNEEENSDEDNQEEEEESPPKKKAKAKVNKLFEEIEVGIDLDNEENNFPNMSTLVISTIISCLEDTNNLVRKEILDFMISNLKPTSPLLTDENRVTLIEATLSLLANRDVSQTRRVNIWLFGKPDQENKYIINEQNAKLLPLIVQGFRGLFLHNAPEYVDQQKIQVQTPIKILQNFFMEHENLIKDILQPLSIALIEYIYKYCDVHYPFSGEILKTGQRFMQSYSHYIDLILNSLSEETQSNIKQLNDQRCQFTLKLTEFVIEQLMKPDNNKEFENPLSCLQQALSGLFKSFESLTAQNIQEFKFIYPSLRLIQQLSCKLEADYKTIKESEQKYKIIQQQQHLLSPPDDAQDNNNNEQMVLDFTNNEQLLERQSAQLNANVLILDSSIRCFCVFYENLVKIFLDDQREAKAELVQIFKVSTKILVQIQMFQNKKENIERAPEWFNAITECIKTSQPQVNLIAIDAMIEILISEKKDPIYEQLKNMIIEESKGKMDRNQVTEGQDYRKVTLEKLWSLLDYPQLSEQVISLIINFTRFFPQYFKDVLLNSFSVGNFKDQELAIKRFSIFWKQSSIQFTERNILRELNKVGLFVMLDFLDNENPLIRHASKNWLIDSIPQFYRIIDPIFEDLLLATSHTYETFRGQVIFTDTYDTRRTNDTFRKLKSILIVASDVFLKYVSNMCLSPNIEVAKTLFTQREESFIFSDKIDPKSLLNNIAPEDKKLYFKETKKMTYLDLLILLCLRFTQGQALDSISAKFQQGNSQVNASSCEFLELLLQHIEDPLVSMQISKNIIETLLRTLNHAIINKDFVMQIQLLNLLKVIFFHSAFCHKNTFQDKRLILIPIFSSRLYMPNILMGLQTEESYVRAQFITFISTSIPLLSNYLQHPVLTNVIKSIMFTYSNLIRDIVQSRNDSSKQIQGVDSQLLSRHVLSQSPSAIQIAQQQQFQQQSFQQESQDSHDSNQNSYEISNILQGMSVIINYFLKLKKIEDLEQNLSAKPEATISGTLATVFTLGIYQQQQQSEKEKQEYFFEKHQETCQCIIYDIKQVVEMLVLSWDVSKDFDQVCEFTDLGCKQYTFLHYNLFNSRLIHSLKMENQTKLKRMIIKIFKPLYLQYPLELTNCLLLLWNREVLQESPDVQSFQVRTPSFLKQLVELLLVSNINYQVFMDSVAGSFFMNKVVENNARRHPKEKKNLYALNYDAAVNESKMMYFLYVYFSHAYIDAELLKTANLLNLWNQLFRLLAVLRYSKNPSTNLWIIELLFMMSEKYSPKEILNDKKFRNFFHELLNEKMLFLTQFVSGQFSYLLNPDQSTQPQQTEVQDSLRFRMVAPFPPYHYQLITEYLQLLESQKQENAELDPKLANELTLKMFANSQTSDEEDIIVKYKLFTLRTLQKVGLELLQNSYSSDKNDRINTRTREFVEPLWPVIENKANDLKLNLFQEGSAELLYSLIERNPQALVKEFKKQILQVFNSDAFFSCSKSTIKFMGKIVNLLVLHDVKSANMLQEYLDKVKLETSFFSKESTENKKRIKSFKRICFIIWSGEIDKYTDKQLASLLDKISEVIRNSEKAHPSLLILILFCIRILILRLSQNNLSTLFSQIWPILITLLIWIYQYNKSRGVGGRDTQIKNPNLLLAGLKFIELLSIMQIDQFYQHQWMFVFDYFGLKINNQVQLLDQLEQQSTAKKSKKKEKDLDMFGPQRMSPFMFQPYISNCVPSQDYRILYLNKQDPEIRVGVEKQPRKIIMNQSIVQDENQLKQQAQDLLQYLILETEVRSQIDVALMEQLIEEDFVNLNETSLMDQSILQQSTTTGNQNPQ